MTLQECITEFSYNLVKYSYAGDFEITLPYHLFVRFYLELAPTIHSSYKTVPASIRLYAPTGIIMLRRGNP